MSLLSVSDLLIDYEKEFSQNSYNGNEASDDKFKIISGSIPILLVAVHCVNHFRKNKVKYADINTGTIVKKVCKDTGCFGIVITKFDTKDHNFSVSNTEFRTKLKELVYKNHIGLVLDIHGAAAKRKFNVDLGTNFGNSIRDSHTEELVRVLNINGVHDITIDSVFPAAGTGTINSFVHRELGEESIQLEINKRYRTDSNLELTINGIDQFVNYAKDYY